MDWTGKKILLTGATGGFGSRLARQLSTRGASLFLVDLKVQPEFLKEIQSLSNGDVQSLNCDLSTEAGCKKLVSAIRRKWKDLDMIIHNAGIARSGAFHHVPLDETEKVLSVNLLAPIRISHGLHDCIRNDGMIVHISSVAGLLSPAGLASYAVTKWGIRSLGDVLDQELVGRNVRVLNIHPFFTKTAILDSPTYGPGSPASLPSWLIDDPDKVVAGMIRAMERRKRRYLPGLMARMSYFGSRFMPDVIHYLSRRQVATGKHPIAGKQ